MKRLSNLMLIASFVSTLFYSASYPYIYAETIKAVSKHYISFEQFVSCVGVVTIGTLWNRYSNKLFKHYAKFLTAEIAADVFLFAHVIVTGNIKFYFLLNVVIYSVITKNLCCGGVKMRALVHNTEESRERYDNNSNSVNAVATIIGTIAAAVLPFSLTALFILALIGNTVDNIFYYYIYSKVVKSWESSY